MPIYLYSDDRTEKIYEILQTMLEPHVAFAEDGYPLKRVFLPVFGGIDTRIDPFNKRKFVEKTKNYNTLGAVSDSSEELGQKRANKLGYDPNKLKFYERYKKKTGGKDHPDITRQKAKEQLNKVGVELV